MIFIPSPHPPQQRCVKKLIRDTSFWRNQVGWTLVKLLILWWVPWQSSGNYLFHTVKCCKSGWPDASPWTVRCRSPNVQIACQCSFLFKWVRILPEIDWYHYQGASPVLGGGSEEAPFSEENLIFAPYPLNKRKNNFLIALLSSLMLIKQECIKNCSKPFPKSKNSSRRY